MMMIRQRLIVGMMFFLLAISALPAQAQDTPTPTPTPIPFQITDIDPNTVLENTSEDVLIFGSSFSPNTTISLVIGGTATPLSVQFVSSTSLIAAVPDTLAPGNYIVRANDNNGTPTDTSDDVSAIAAERLRIVAPTPTPTDTPTATPTSTPAPLTISSSEPTRMTSGRESTLSVIGTGFTPNTTIRLVGIGVLPTNFINSTSINASVPVGSPAGNYSIRVSDPSRSSNATSPTTLRIIAQPTPTVPPTLTPPPPTPEPGSPSLIVNSYNVNPQAVAPGRSTSVTVTVLNQGNQVAESVSAAIDPSGAFVPVGNQASVVLPNIAPNTRFTFTVQAEAKPDAESGTVNIPLLLNYRNYQNQMFNNTANIAASIVAPVEETLLNLAGYRIEPEIAEPGELVTVALLINNSGTAPANQVVVNVPVSNGVLIAGPQGSSFPAGNIPAGATTTQRITLRVSNEASPGSQSQPLSIAYLQDGEAQQFDANITVPVDAMDMGALLLSSYETRRANEPDEIVDSVQPGQRFTLSAMLTNIGRGVDNVLVSFPAENGNFAPIGGGGTVFVGDVEGDGGTFDVEHDFLVSGSLTSGVYNLPLTATYRDVTGETAEATFNASVLVLIPPRLRFIEDQPLPRTIRRGDNISFALRVVNNGQQQVNLTTASLRAENGDIFSDEELLLNPLRQGDEVFIEGSFVPDEPGTTDLIIELEYINALNQVATLEQVYSFDVNPRPTPPPTRDPATVSTPVPTTTPPETLPDDFWERVLLGLLGLGR